MPLVHLTVEQLEDIILRKADENEKLMRKLIKILTEEKKKGAVLK